MTSRDGSTISYTSYNLPSLINAGANSSALAYGAFRNRYKQVAITAGVTETTIYVAGLLEKVTKGGVTEYRHLIGATPGTVALYTRRTSGTLVDTYYLHRDHLGSPELITNAAGAQVVKLAFGAYGERRDTDWEGPVSAADLATIGNITRHGFTGHEHLDSVGLIHMNGRVYDPVVGRFLSRDPFIDDVASSQGPNGYAYVHNNPLSYVDPSGFGIEPAVIVEASRLRNLMRETYLDLALQDAAPIVNSDGELEEIVVTAPRDDDPPPTAIALPIVPTPQGECWSGEQGNLLDGVSGLARQVGNQLMWLGGFLGGMGTLSSTQHAANATTFGSNNTNAGILGANLAPAVYVVAAGGAAGVARFAGLRGGAQGAREFLGLVGNRSIQMDHVFSQAATGGSNAYWNLYPTAASLNRLMGQANNWTLSTGSILQGAFARAYQNGQLGAAAGFSAAVGVDAGGAIAARSGCN